MEFKRLQSLEGPMGAYAARILTHSFPPEERRDLKKWGDFTENQPDFFNCVVTEKQQPIGLIAYWRMSRFIYIEHLAIDSTLRGNGLGSRLLNTFLASLDLPVVLEVEHPTTPIAQRRISFYRRCGLTLWKHNYLQPPYRKGDPFLPLYIMAYGNLNETTNYPFIRKEIYLRVYGINE